MSEQKKTNLKSNTKQTQKKPALCQVETDVRSVDLKAGDVLFATKHNCKVCIENPAKTEKGILCIWFDSGSDFHRERIYIDDLRYI